MKNFVLLALFCMATNLAALVGLASDAPFSRWTGTWKGACQLSPPYNGTERFDASLTVGKDEGANGVQWQLIYEASGNLPRQVRNYSMRPINASKGHYVVDENNGLLLDSFIDQDMIYSPFQINGKIITATYVLIGKNKMIMDMPTFDAIPVRKSCVTGNPNLCAESFGLRMTQRCNLEKISKN